MLPLCRCRIHTPWACCRQRTTPSGLPLAMPGNMLLEELEFSTQWLTSGVLCKTCFPPMHSSQHVTPENTQHPSGAAVFGGNPNLVRLSAVDRGRSNATFGQ